MSNNWHIVMSIMSSVLLFLNRTFGKCNRRFFDLLNIGDSMCMRLLKFLLLRPIDLRKNILLSRCCFGECSVLTFRIHSS
jgi:hypothetical protein